MTVGIYKIEDTNMHLFCKNNGCNPAHMISIATGSSIRKQHKGWTKPDPDWKA